MNQAEPTSRAARRVAGGVSVLMLIAAVAGVIYLIAFPDDPSNWSYAFCIAGIVNSLSVLRHWILKLRISAWDLTMITISIVALLFWV